MKNEKNDMPEELKLLSEWKQRLGLQDWFITLTSHCKPEEMEENNCDGCVVYEETQKSAAIQIVDPKYRPSGIRTFDFEVTLIHELLHLKFCLLERKDDWNKLQMRVLHQIIDDVAKALKEAKTPPEGAG